MSTLLKWILSYSPQLQHDVLWCISDAAEYKKDIRNTQNAKMCSNAYVKLDTVKNSVCGKLRDSRRPHLTNRVLINTRHI